MAVGAAVVLCDYEGSGPLVTPTNFSVLRPLNFGKRALCGPLDAAIIGEEIRRYNPAEARQVSETVRAIAGHESVVDELINLYEEVIGEFQQERQSEPAEEGRPAAAYLRQLKMDFAANTAAAIRLRERVERVPLVGRIAIKLAAALMRSSRLSSF
jgi:hypothetical protein